MTYLKSQLKNITADNPRTQLLPQKSELNNFEHIYLLVESRPSLLRIHLQGTTVRH